MLRIIFTFVFLMVPLCAMKGDSNSIVFQEPFNSISIHSNENSFDIDAFIEKNQEYVQSRNENLQKIFDDVELVKIYKTYLNAKQNLYYLSKDLDDCIFYLKGKMDKETINWITLKINDIGDKVKKNKELIVFLKKSIIYKYCENIEEPAIKNLIKMKKGRIGDSDNDNDGIVTEGTTSDLSKKKIKYKKDQL